MTDEDQKRIFSKNLNYYISQSDKQQKEIAKLLGYSPTTFNTWCVGKIIPSTGKIQKIADFFGISKSDLLDEHSDDSYYLDAATAKKAQEIFSNKDLALLFDAAIDASPEDIQTVHQMLLALKRKEARGNTNDI